MSQRFQRLTALPKRHSALLRIAAFAVVLTAAFLMVGEAGSNSAISVDVHHMKHADQSEADGPLSLAT